MTSPQPYSQRPSTPTETVAENSIKPIQFQFPLERFKRIGRGYHGRHKGVDVSAPKGTPVLASEAGWVTYQGRRFKGYGKLIIIEHSERWATFYAHLNNYEAQEGTWVRKGDVIGYVGSTGRSTAPHLHFEIRFNNNAIDPLQFFASSLRKVASAQE